MQATPGLKKLTWVFPIQLQVLNGVDNLGVHFADSHFERVKCRWNEVGCGCGKKDRNQKVNYAPLERKVSSTKDTKMRTVYIEYISHTHPHTIIADWEAQTAWILITTTAVPWRLTTVLLACDSHLQPQCWTQEHGNAATKPCCCKYRGKTRMWGSACRCYSHDTGVNWCWLTASMWSMHL